MDEINKSDPAYCLTSINAHRLIAAGLVLALKYTQDQYYTNHHYSKIAGVPLRELNSMEFDFFQRVNYNINAKPETVCAYFEQLLMHMEKGVR